MASLINDGNGTWRVQFFHPSEPKRRRTLRPGRMSVRDANRFLVGVESLVSALKQERFPDDETALWLGKLSDDLTTRLAAVGLIKPKAAPSINTLGALLEKFMSIQDVKPNTRVTYEQTRRELLAYFGADRDISTIGPLQADEWRQWQKNKGLAEATISRRVKTCRQVFRKAIKWKLMVENPFEEVKTGSQQNRSRQRFISREMADQVLKACPNADWRVIFALSRFGGLRCPSETLLLRWSDVDWDKGTLTVTSPKTEHFAGKDRRVIPLFPELRRYLYEAFEAAPVGSEFVVSSYRRKNSNMRTQFERILARAGIEPWPRLFHNLRSTRQTELGEQFPAHVVCAWMGNTEKIADAHYNQVTDEHFRRAASTEQAAQNAAQLLLELIGNGVQLPWPIDAKTTGIPVVASDYGCSQSVRMTPTGIEPVSRP